MITIRIAATISRPDLAVLLRQSCRLWGGQPTRLSRRPLDGYHYAQLDSEGAASTFEAVLTDLVIIHSRVDLPDAPRAAASCPQPDAVIGADGTMTRTTQTRVFVVKL